MIADSPLPYHEPTGFSRRALEEYRRAARSVVFDFIFSFCLDCSLGFEWPMVGVRSSSSSIQHWTIFTVSESLSLSLGLALLASTHMYFDRSLLLMYAA